MIEAADVEGVEGRAHVGDRLVAILPAGDELGNHGIVVDGDLPAFVDAGIDAHALAVRGRRDVADEPPHGGQELAVRVLRVDAALDRPAVLLDVLLAQRQPLAGGDADHRLDEVDAGRELRHRVLDLEPRVHLEEIEIALAIDDELDGARGAIADRARDRERLLAHGAAGLGIEEGARRLLDDLLVPALDRAFALAEMDEVAVGVAQDLDLDMARLLDVFLEEDPVVAEGGARLVLRRAQALADLGVARRDAHALPAPAGRGLDHHRIADAARELDRRLGIDDGLVVTRHRLDPGGKGQALRFDLVAHRGDRGLGRADELDLRQLERLREGRVLREKAVAGVDRF